MYRVKFTSTAGHPETSPYVMTIEEAGTVAKGLRDTGAKHLCIEIQGGELDGIRSPNQVIQRIRSKRVSGRNSR